MFTLKRTAKTSDVWKELLARPLDAPEGVRRFRITVGRPDGEPFPSTASLKVRVYREQWPVYALFALGLAAALAFFFRQHLGNLLRDPGSAPDTPRGAFSLGRVQLALWTAIVIVTFTGIYVVTGYLDSLNETAFVLLGLSAGTAALSVSVDGQRKQTAIETIRAMDSKIRNIEEAQEKLTLRAKGAPDAPTIKEELAALARTITERKEDLQELARHLAAAAEQESWDALLAQGAAERAGWLQAVEGVGDARKRVRILERERLVRSTELSGLESKQRTHEAQLALLHELSEHEEQLAQANADVEREQALVDPKSAGAIKDLLGHAGSGTQLHRLQLALWTALLACIYCVEAFRTLRMPEFSASLLGLMGISSAGYVTLKATSTSQPASELRNLQRAGAIVRRG